MKTIPFTMRIEPQIKEEAQKLARTLGFNLSSVIDAYLRQFIRTKEISFSLTDEMPSERLLRNIEISEKEYKGGNVKKFSNEEEALTFLRSSRTKASKS